MTPFAAIAEAFQAADPDLRLEMLLEYAERLPPLPPVYRPLRDAGLGMVHECQAPVFLHVDVKAGRVHLVGDVPAEAPTARGFTAVLLEAFDGASPEAVAAAPPDALRALGLAGLLGTQRTQGLHAIYGRIRAEVARKAGG